MSDKARTREERIAYGKRVAAENRDEIQARTEKSKAEAVGRVRELAGDELRKRADELKSVEGVEFIGPEKSKREWIEARAACRQYVIDAVREDRLVFYDELRVLTYEVTGMTLGHSMFPRMCEEINDKKADGCLLSSFVVRKDDGQPGEGFYTFARSQGFDAPLETLQDQVREKFGRPAQ